ncbi:MULTISPECIES: FUSC family protein [unclassified Chelatococcus]|uniref:FUSC family protein n=1 Tax=unclassified Chelatococcus TaxID=2638111 RepID=UPI001BCE11A0|nr:MULTISPECIES: FUSC family protein [unclassified Chelatococcus]CAH1669128.1 Integral membrane protein [Hyphomicrobiales bacterium]MBS7739376.1 FUSC family protein [Chelatococcus sp. HY11]MBX3546857.1 FUSC family protein [Chelatococcus sp.]MCO5076089.1 FUSC family protein [Chelatococcus sp.]CAH1679414.1 Integral membrane protein [Hyphomicrobiales bacterium]
MLDATRSKLRSIPFEGMSALLCMPALVVTLAYGALSGDVIHASILTGGALAVGFGSVHAFTDYRSAPMLLAAIGIAISTFVGSLVGNHELLFILTAVLWAATCAIFATIEFGAWWIILQWSIALFVAGYFPADMTGAAARAGLAFTGGLLQFCLVLIGWRISGGPRSSGAHHSIRRIRKSLRLARHGRLPTVRHAARAGLSVAIALGVVHWMDLPYGYWAAMTAFIVLRPQLRATRTRGFERLMGTLVGAGLATIISLMQLSDAIMLVLTLVTAWLAYGLQRSRYILFTIAITATIVFVLTLEHQPGPLSALHRLFATALGGIIALVIAFITSPKNWPAPLRRSVSAPSGFIRGALAQREVALRRRATKAPRLSSTRDDVT